MKKLLAIFLLCGIGAAVFAQSPSADYHGRNYETIHAQPTELDKAIEKAAKRLFGQADVDPSTIKVGKYIFELKEESDVEENGRMVHVYSYQPKNGPAVFGETIEQDLFSQNYHITVPPIGLSAKAVQHVDYTLSQINISVYKGNQLLVLEKEWIGQFSNQCVSRVKMFGSQITNMMNVLATPLRAFYVGDNTVKIEAVLSSSSSNKIKNYPRFCSEKASGELYKKFMKGTDAFMQHWGK